MKQLILLSSALTFVLSHNVFAQEAKVSKESYFIQCSDFNISKPLRELAELHPAIEIPDNEKKEAVDANSNRHSTIYPNQNPNHVQDPVIQKTYGYRTSSAPIVNFTANRKIV